MGAARQRYIVVEGWRDFQHYKDRGPLWIKSYTRLLDDDTYLELTGPQRALLHGLWLAYAKTHGKVPESTAWLTRYLNLRVTKGMLTSLDRAGFIRSVASAALAERYRDACLEKEKEKEKEKDSPKPPHQENHSRSNGKGNLEHVRHLLQNGGYEMTNASLKDEFEQRGLTYEQQAELWDYVLELRGIPEG
jgi:hypothetical protein